MLPKRHGLKQCMQFLQGVNRNGKINFRKKENLIADPPSSRLGSNDLAIGISI